MEPAAGENEVCVKSEPSFAEAINVKSEGSDEDVCFKDEPSWLGDCVKQDSSWLETEGACGVSEAAAAAGLYADHVVKDELVLGPELVEPPRALCVDQNQGQIRWKEQTGTNLYQCVDSSYVAANKSSLIKKPTGEKPYKCDHCSYATGQKHHLRIHEIIHTGERPHKCAQCDFACARKSGLTAHEKRKACKRQYKCGQCDFSSFNKSQFKHHEKQHSGEKPYKYG